MKFFVCVFRFYKNDSNFREYMIFNIISLKGRNYVSILFQYSVNSYMIKIHNKTLVNFSNNLIYRKFWIGKIMQERKRVRRRP